MTAIEASLPAAEAPGDPLQRPYVICHMVTSIDGRTKVDRWRPEDPARKEVFARLHERLNPQAWLVGRVTGQEYAKLNAYPGQVDQTFRREPWFATRTAGPLGIVLDPHGKIAWGRSEIEGDPLVAVLTEQVSDAHLAGLRSDGVSYVFAGKQEINPALALGILRQKLGIERLEINGGGITNGEFLRAGLIDEISLAIFPAVDGTPGAPCIFDSSRAEISTLAPLTAVTLQSNEVLDGGVLWLRYSVKNN
jgi:riboflavin biosynthesis pyrimidine reductase